MSKVINNTSGGGGGGLSTGTTPTSTATPIKRSADQSASKVIATARKSTDTIMSTITTNGASKGSNGNNSGPPSKRIAIEQNSGKFFLFFRLN